MTQKQSEILEKMNGEKSTRIMAGTLAGWSIVTVGQPLDYLKTMYQIRSHHLPTINQIYRDIGLRGFYKGASSIYLFAGVVTALEFQTFERSIKKLNELGLRKGGQPSVLSLMIAGCITGAVCSFIYTPIEYAKIHSQIEHKPTQGSAARIFATLKNERLPGLKKLYTGHGITLFKQSIGSAFYYGGYHATLTRIFKQKRQTAATWAQLLSGGIAGVIYQIYSYPFDTVKTNIQSGKKTFKEMVHGKFWSTSNFSNGLKVSLLRSFIVDAVNFTVYENARHALLGGYQRFFHQ